jgi:hypothetical protein
MVFVLMNLENINACVEMVLMVQGLKMIVMILMNVVLEFINAIIIQSVLIILEATNVFVGMDTIIMVNYVKV